MYFPFYYFILIGNYGMILHTTISMKCGINVIKLINIRKVHIFGNNEYSNLINLVQIG